MFEVIRKLIESHDVIVLHRHQNPDGDALGSQIGLKHLILDNYPGKTVYTVGDPAGRYAFMEDSVMDEVPDEVYADALAIVLDTSAKALISDERYSTAAATARIDHHLFCETIAETEVVDSSFESCCGLIAASNGVRLEAVSAVGPIRFYRHGHGFRALSVRRGQRAHLPFGRVSARAAL